MNPASASAAPNQTAMPPTNVVDNIPVRMQSVVPAPVNEDAELDKIMQDVGHELKKDTKKPAKHGFLHFGHKSKKEPPFTAQAIRSQPASVNSVPVPAATHSVTDVKPVPATPTRPIVPSQPVPQTKSNPAPAAAVKPKKQTTVPFFVIFVAILATGFLIASAIAAYRQQ